jgi:Tol biopolymer transport system component
MAPEQIRGERLTARTDIYSLGIVLFEMLTGVRPFRGDIDVPPGVGDNQSDRVRYQQLYVPTPEPRTINPQVPQGLAQVVLKALAKVPDQRYSSVQAMAGDIAGVVAARFETLPDRVRLPGEMLRGSDGWQPEPPPAEEMPVIDEVDWEHAVEYGAPSDTLPGQPPPPRLLPERPATYPASASFSTHPRARIPARLIGLLAVLALLTFCGLMGVRFAGGFRLGSESNLPVPPPSQTQTEKPAPSSAPSQTASVPADPSQTRNPTPSLAPSPTASRPAAPSQTPTGLSDFPVSGEIVFVMRSEGVDRLYLMDATSGQSSTLPLVPNVTPSVSNAPQWSPDGQRLTWISQYNSRLHVVVMDMTEREPYQLAAGEAYSRVSAPAFRPDGNQVTFWAAGGGGGTMVTADAVTGEEAGKTTLNIYRNMFTWNWKNNLLAYIHGSGSSYKVAVSDTADGDARLVDTGGEGYAPAWSNDGQWLAFQSDLNRDAGIDEIWIAHPDGSDLHAVTSSPEGIWSRAPSFSPDGKMIAFISNRSGSLRNDYGELFVVDLINGQVRQLTNTGGQVYDWRPAWRP